MLARRLPLKLMAPTVLLSLILVAACIVGTLSLNQLRVNASEVLRENVQSTEAATHLESSTQELVRLLRGDHADLEALNSRIRHYNDSASDLLSEAERFANLEREKALVRQIGTGLRDYLGQWEKRADLAPERLPAFDRTLADHLDEDVLALCTDLRKFNAVIADQIQQSDRENHVIVETLKWGMLIVGLGGPLSGLVLGYAVASRLNHSIYQLSVRIRDAAGRLNRELGSVTLEEKGDLTHVHRQMQTVVDEIGRIIDQLQQREHEVLRAEQLAAVGQVAAGMAHELRNPLTAIKLLVQTGLEESSPGGLPREDLTVVVQEVRRMEECIRMFLDFARPPRSERRSTDLAAVIRRAVMLVEGRARRQQVILVTELPATPTSLMIDPEQVNQVLVNLLLNALDTLPQGGKVLVEMNRNGLSPEIEVRVRDNGTGIAPAVRHRLFEPFVSTKESGLGLGLSICKRLIDAHGGTIRGEDAPGGGAVFTLTFPLDKESASANQLARV